MVVIEDDSTCARRRSHASLNYFGRSTGSRCAEAQCTCRIAKRFIKVSSLVCSKMNLWPTCSSLRRENLYRLGVLYTGAGLHTNGQYAGRGGLCFIPGNQQNMYFRVRTNIPSPRTSLYYSGAFNNSIP